MTDQPTYRAPRVLILSGGTGAGHVIAARAIEDELRRSGAEVHHLDAYAFVSPLARWAYTQLHLNLLEFIPEVYGPLYERGSESRMLARLQHRLAVRSRAGFGTRLRDLQPDVIVVTHALGCALAAPLKHQGGFRLVVLTTDYRAHAFQVHEAVDAYCASHAWAAADLQAAGIPKDRIRVTGIPLRAQFDAVPTKEDARARLRLHATGPVILVTRGGMAAGQETVDLLGGLLRAPALREAQIVAVLGGRPRGARLVSQRIAPSPRLRVERFVDPMETYLAAADVVVGKAGGLSSTETFTVGRPLVIFAPNEGIETANVARFVAAGAALHAGRSVDRAVALVSALLADPRERAALVARGRALLTPASRQAVARAVTQPRQVPARVSGSG